MRSKSGQTSQMPSSDTQGQSSTPGEEITRRKFLEFLGRTSVAASSAVVGSTTLAPIAGLAKTSSKRGGDVSVSTVKPGLKDDLVLASGFRYSVIASCGDKINSRGDKFGDCADFVCFFPDSREKPTSGTLWVNHEYLLPHLTTDWVIGTPKSKKQVDTERELVGGSFIRVERNAKSGDWRLVQDDKNNRRLSGSTKIPLVAERDIEGTRTAIGTMANCAGGLTPWGNVLTCEENYQDYYGEVSFDPASGQRTWNKTAGYAWVEHYSQPPEHYGWVVEVSPKTGEAKKLVALGRFAHEGATVVVAKNGLPVAYMGDDARDQCIYKFIGDRAGSLDSGNLYVANLTAGRWEHLHVSNPTLAGKFRDQTDLLIRTREAAKLAGGTPCDRPEDVEIDPQTGAVLVALTNNDARGNLHGSILRIVESGDDPLAREFKHSTFLTGGAASGFSCPDNLAFDPRGNLWMTSDISGSKIGKGEHQVFGNNGLFWIPMTGKNAGKVHQIGYAPVDAEMTGPWFSPDGSTLFVSVQHPGEQSGSKDQLTSHWPKGGKSLPMSSIVAIHGPGLERLMQA